MYTVSKRPPKTGLVGKDDRNEDEIDIDKVSINVNHAVEYVVDQIVDHTVEGSRMLYRVHWDGCSADDSTIELAGSIPKHIIRRY